MTTLTNILYDDITIGQTAEYSQTLTEEALVLFAKVSGDVNPVHLDADFAANTMFKERIGHGAWTGSIISAALALTLPGPGGIYISQSLSFRAPVKVNDTVTIKLEVTAKNDKRQFVTIKTIAVNQEGTTVAKGEAVVIPGKEKMDIKAPELPPITVG